MVHGVRDVLFAVRGLCAVCARLCARSLWTMLMVFSVGEVRRGCILWIVEGVLCCLSCAALVLRRCWFYHATLV